MNSPSVNFPAVNDAAQSASHESPAHPWLPPKSHSEKSQPEQSSSEDSPSVLVEQLTKLLQAGEAVPSTRCAHLYPNSTRCRLPLHDPYTSFCSRHKKLHPAGLVDPALKVTAGVADFRSAVHLNEFLGQLLIAVVEGRISPRRAAVLGSLGSKILRTIPVIGRQINDEGPVIINDLPRPIPGYRAGT